MIHSELSFAANTSSRAEGNTFMRIIGRAVHSEIIEMVEQTKRYLIVNAVSNPWLGLTIAIDRAILRGVAVQLIARGCPSCAGPSNSLGAEQC